VSALVLHELHQSLNARFLALNGAEAVDHYGDPLAEHRVLRDSVGVVDLSHRGRLCLTGADAVRFLNGQVTNNVKALAVGQGCYAAVVTAKGKLESDANVFRLPEELLLDFEPGLTESLARRFEKYIIADDVQVVDASPHYGLLSLQGPLADKLVRSLGLNIEIPAMPWGFASLKEEHLGQIYLMNLPRTGTAGFDWFVPVQSLPAMMQKLMAGAEPLHGGVCGWQGLEIARFEAGIPRFGADMDETNLAPEAGIEARAISYAKGCYIGQEVIARVRTYGQVAKSLRGLRLADGLSPLPAKRDPLFKDGKEAGYITTALASPTWNVNLALGYVRREANQIGTALSLRNAAGETQVQVIELPFSKNFA
jgi:folate-binding protein YgfZ